MKIPIFTKELVVTVKEIALQFAHSWTDLRKDDEHRRPSFS
jgi:hypothetical protein